MATKNLEFPLFRYLVYTAGQLAPAVGYKVYVYEAGTSTPLTTYSDAALTTPNSHPVVLNADGSAVIYYAESAKIDLKTPDESASVSGFPVDGVNPTLDTVVSGNYNLVLNGDFEELEDGSSTEPDNWVLAEETSAIISIDNTTSISGLRSLKFAGGGSGGGSATSDFFNVTGGSTLSLAFSYKSSHVGTTNTVVINWFDSAGASVGSPTTAFNDAGTSPTSWESNLVKVSVPATARKAKVILTGVSSGGANLAEDTWFDGVLIAPSETLATTVTIADAGSHYTGTDVEAALQELGPALDQVGQASTVTLGAAAASVSLTGLSFTANNEIVVDLTFPAAPTGSGTTVYLEINGDSTDTNYRSVISTNSGAVVSSDLPSTGVLVGADDAGAINLRIVPNSTEGKCYVYVNGMRDTAPNFTLISGVIEYEISAVITSIGFRRAGGTDTPFNIGTRLTVREQYIVS